MSRDQVLPSTCWGWWGGGESCVHQGPGAVFTDDALCLPGTPILQHLRTEELRKLNRPGSQSWDRKSQDSSPPCSLPHLNIYFHCRLPAGTLRGILTLCFCFSFTRLGRYRCEKGTTAVLTEKITPLEIEVLEETVQTMDTS